MACLPRWRSRRTGNWPTRSGTKSTSMSGNQTRDGLPFPRDPQQASRSFRLRDALARLARATPFFPGKPQLCKFLNRSLTDRDDDRQAIVTTRLRDGSLFRLDLRSAAEWPAFWTGQYDQPMLDLLARLLPRGAVVLD